MAYRVIIIGGGFGGLSVAKELGQAKCEIFLFDKLNHHLFQPLLYEVATAALSPGEIATPLRELLRKQENITVMMGEIVSIDPVKKQVLIANGEKMSYDYLVVAVGSRHSYFGNDAWEKVAPGLKTIGDALKIREQILISFEKAERIDSISQAQKQINFVIIGGGPTGIEMAGAIADITSRTMFKNFRRIKPEKSKIYLIEALPTILPSYPPRLSRRAQKDLEKMGVQVITGKKVTSITEEGVQVGDVFLESKNVIWAAGNQASPLLKTLGVPLDRQGRVIVEKDLSVPGFPEVFVIGDAAHVERKQGPIPAIATAAIQEGGYVAKLIHSQVPKEKRSPFRYFDKGSMATIGRGKAIVHFWKLQFTGLFAWLIWALIHVFYLIGFRNRFGVMLEWLVIMFTGQRGVRLIHKTIDPEIPPPK